MCGWAQGADPARAPDHAASASNAPSRERGNEPAVQRMVIEDNGVRVDELRVRGVTRRIVVQSKLPGAPAYEIVSKADGRDASQDRRTEGRSLWQLFDF
jgi:hypothetical protein